MLTIHRLPAARKLPRPQPVLVAAACLLLAAQLVRADENLPARPLDFARDIQPILAQHCQECHGAKRRESGLRLTDRDSALAGGDSGEKVIVPGDPAASLLVRVVTGADADRPMPPPGEKEPLTKAEVELLTRWVREGAVWPADARVENEAPTHWAWQSPRRAELPAVHNAAWPRHPLDYFVLANLERNGLKPTAEADRYLLVRRVYLDLIGLPPTPAQVDAFVGDPRPDAYERMVDRVLADPGFGERWARVWLDLARYADSKGYGSDPLRTIWRYRDWTIDAFNRNLPFDQFTIEQLAGDLLPGATDEQILATAFHRNTMANDEGGTDDEEFRVAAVKDRIETTMQVWMGLTMGCAKCHTHKFDPITQREYYQAYAIFDQTEDADRGDETPLKRGPTPLQQQELSAHQARIAALESRLAQPPEQFPATIAAWEARWREQASQWFALDIQAATATDGTSLKVLDDRSILAGGNSPERDIYRLTAASAQPRVTALRLEVFPDDSLPQRGPGRAAGNFVLNELQVAKAGPSDGVAGVRFVRIELPGKQRILSLAEVQVWRKETNLAPQGKATQSSMYSSAKASLANDGNTDGKYENSSVSHTADEDNPWWQVDLGASGPVERVVVWNRTDLGVESRLAGFRLVLLDEARRVVWEKTHAETPMPQATFDLTAGTDLRIKSATADFAQEKFPASAAADSDSSDKTGWAVAPQTGVPHEAVFLFEQPVELASGQSLTISIRQTYGGQHTLGKFRLLATSANDPLESVPAAIRQILAIEPATRTAAAQASLVQYVWSQSAESHSLTEQIKTLRSAIAALEKESPTTPILRELPPDKRRVTRVMIKGNFQQLGDPVEPALPAAFHPPEPGTRLDRLALARWLVRRENPLTARVVVNRFWSRLFGAGLVLTEEDFGTQGMPPTHPEVLDLLAVEFMDHGWDMKDLLRQIVCSATYRQSSTCTPEVLEKDPGNRLLARGPSFRLEAEMVRDQALAISGLLTAKLGGPSVYPPQPPGLWRAAFNGQRTWPTSTGEDRYRRGIYTFWRRTVPYPAMATFDAPSREICVLRRISTNTPLQAFVTLNDPAFVEAAQALARRMVREGGAEPAERCAFALRLALARPPQAEQIDRLVALYQSERAHFAAHPEDAMTMATEPLGPLPAGTDAAEMAAWTVVSNVILNLDGLVTRR